MKSLITTLVVMGMFLTPAALADDADDVKAAAEAPEKEVTQARLDAGMQINMQMRNFDIKVYGDTAITTYYSVGLVQRPGSSTSERWNLRTTGVWIKQTGEWMLVHRHESPLTLR